MCAIAFPYCSFKLRLVVIVVVVISVEMVSRKRGAHKIDCVDEATDWHVVNSLPLEKLSLSFYMSNKRDNLSPSGLVAA